MKNRLPKDDYCLELTGGKLEEFREVSRAIFRLYNRQPSEEAVAGLAGFFLINGPQILKRMEKEAAEGAQAEPDAGFWKLIESGPH